MACESRLVSYMGFHLYYPSSSYSGTPTNVALTVCASGESRKTLTTARVRFTNSLSLSRRDVDTTGLACALIIPQAEQLSQPSSEMCIRTFTTLAPSTSGRSKPSSSFLFLSMPSMIPHPLLSPSSPVLVSLPAVCHKQCERCEHRLKPCTQYLTVFP